MDAVESYRARRQPADPHGVGIVTGLVGAGILGLGVFSPLVNVPLLGGMNFMAGPYGKYLLAAAGGAALASLLRQQWASAAIGIGALGFLARHFTMMQLLADERKQKLADETSEAFAGLARIAAEAMQPQWGWAVLAIGCLTLVAARVVSEPPRNRTYLATCAVALVAIAVLSGVGIALYGPRG